MKPRAVVDYETHKIRRRPAYPPKPVGVAIGGDGIRPRYYAWGHPTGNNCDVSVVKRKLAELYRTHRVIFHHAAFDTEVGRVHLGLPAQPDDYEDTMFLGFLYDPRADDLSLKGLAHAHLGIKPRERDKLRKWIVANVPGATEKTWGEYIADAPAQLVEPYAIGDVTRPLKLWEFFCRELEKRDRKYPPLEGQQSWRQAYARELRLMPVIQRMETRGIRVDVRRLRRDVPRWEQRVAEVDAWIVRKLGGPRRVAKFTKDGEFNVGSAKQLAAALDAAGLVTEWKLTAKGNKSTKRENLVEGLKDPKLAQALALRSVLSKYVNTYGKKWLETACKDGFVYPRINQVRNSEDDERDSNAGARTGRLSYSDSWQAIPNVERIPVYELLGKTFEPLPVLRDYVLADDEDDVVIERDYSQQEFRILAHYEDGPLKARYQENPHIDMHQTALEMMNELANLGLDPVRDRRPVKDIGFGLIYGMGLKKTALKVKKELPLVKLLIKTYKQAIPGLKKLIELIEERCENDMPIRTWGGRLYWVEPPAYVEKFQRVMSFEYKMINVLIQGSAGDNTKEAMIRADEAYRAKPVARLMLQIHDALAASARRAKHAAAMKLLREAMESVQFDVRMLSDGKWSPRSWGSLKKFNEEK